MPSPDKYTLPTEFIEKSKISPGMNRGNIFSMGIGRQHYEKVYMPHKKSHANAETPGPGTYTNRVYTCGTGGRKIQMHGRIKNVQGKYSLVVNLLLEPLHINVKKNIPGPGTYGTAI